MQNSWVFDNNWTEKMQEYAKHIARQMLSTLWGVSARHKICLYPETESCRERDQSFETSLRGGKHDNKKKYFEWIFKQLLNLYDVKNYADLGGYLLTWTIDHLWQKNGSKRTDDI